MSQQPEQLGFAFRVRGGSRKGAGRKPNGEKAGIPHRPREFSSRHKPLHVTLRVARGLPSLRAQRTYAAVLEAFKGGKERFGFRLVHFSVLGNHIHMVTEADDRVALGQGMKALCIRIARKVNRVLERRGGLFSDRYHSRVLGTRRETYNCLKYVLLNRQNHQNEALAGLAEVRGLDPCSSAVFFDGWAPGVMRRPVQEPDEDSPVTAARGWHLRTGWRRYGPLRLA